MSNDKTVNPSLAAGFAGEAASGIAKPRGNASSGDSTSWYEAMSKALGNTLDGQAAKLTSLSNGIGGGADQPSNMILLTAESLRMQFMSNSATTVQNSVGQALETLGKKQ